MCVCGVLTVITDLWLMWYCPCLLLMIMQVHIHPIITPTNTTNSSPVADPSIASHDVLAGDALDGVVIASLGVLHGLLGGVQGSGVVLSLVGIFDPPEDFVVIVSHSGVEVVVSSQFSVGQEHCK